LNDYRSSTVNTRTVFHALSSRLLSVFRVRADRILNDYRSSTVNTRSVFDALPSRLLSVFRAHNDVLREFCWRTLVSFWIDAHARAHTQITRARKLLR
jgi:hypothetical protein